MANEDLIYRITRAVYDRLGNAVAESTVEQLVTDIYNQVQSTSSNLGRPAAVDRGAATEGSSDRMVISVFGLDHPGIVAGVSQILADSQLQHHRYQSDRRSGQVRDGDHRRHVARA